MSKNNAWNLEAGDGKLNANSTFEVKEGEFAEVFASNISCDGRIVILKIMRPPECSNMDVVGFIPRANCSARMELNESNGWNARIGDWGEYLVSRMSSSDGKVIRTPEANVLVTKHRMTKGVPPIQNQGFC